MNNNLEGKLNMSVIGQARLNDQNGNIAEAYQLYFDAIKGGYAEYVDYLNAAVIAFLFQDFGMASNKKIDDELIDHSYKNLYWYIDECESKYGETAETNFWRKYFKLILDGSTQYEEDCSQYLKSLSLPAPPKTEMDRYLVSILESRRD